MLNFTVGPVQSNEQVKRIGSENVPYFRTSEFSDIMFENESIMLELVNATEGSKVVFLTGSGTAAMEASVINTLSEKDNAIVINGGGFGKRFSELLHIHRVQYKELVLNNGTSIKKNDLEYYDNKDYSALLVNVHETSTGVLYDLELLSDFCKKNNLFFIVDAISSFLADEINMEKYGIDVLITGSQKALACPPGVSIIILSPNALQRVQLIESHCMYFDLKEALKNQERGQTPFTPAVGILLQINSRLKVIKNNGGAKAEINRVKNLADYFRNEIKSLPFEIASESMSNALTPLRPLNASANDIFNILKDEYGIWICPNGGELKDTLFRVGHIGDLTKNDFDVLIDAFADMQSRGLI